MPVYRALFRSKFSTSSGHMIKCLLTEFSWAERENIGLSAIKQGPRCAPTTQSRKAQYFRFVRHTFVTNKVINMKNKKCSSIFYGARQA